MDRYRFAIYVCFGLLMGFVTGLSVYGQTPRSMIVSDKLALCIGNANYNVLAKLCSGGYCQPRNDATDMAAVFYEAGFDTMVGLDLGLPGMEAKLAQFEAKLQSGRYKTAVFFFAGHGAANKDKENFLIPVNCSNVDPGGIKYAAVSLDKVIDQMSADGVASRVLLIDACRSITRGSGPVGLQYLNPPPQTYIGYATGFGQVTPNGNGRNGLFTEGLLKYCRTKGQSLNDLFNRVTAHVEYSSGKAQSPTMSYRAASPFVLFLGENPISESKPEPPTPSPVNRNYTETAFGLDMVMVYVEGGEYQMGYDEIFTGVRTIVVRGDYIHTESFRISATEVTQQQWVNVMGALPDLNNPCENCPVIGVNSTDVLNFIGKLSQKSGLHYRLPTEAEWEYAARGGRLQSTFPYSGSNLLNDVGWYGEGVESSMVNGNRILSSYAGNSNQRIHPVKQKKPNIIGLYDLSGNAAELCEDLSSDGLTRIVRGGSWVDSKEKCKVSSKKETSIYSKDYVTGFRVVLE